MFTVIFVKLPNLRFYAPKAARSDRKLTNLPFYGRFSGTMEFTILRFYRFTACLGKRRALDHRMVFATAIRVLSKTYRTTRKVISSLVPMEPYSTPSPSRFAFCLHNRISLKSTAFQNASSLVDGFFLGYFQNKYRKISRASTQLHVQKECPHSFNG